MWATLPPELLLQQLLYVEQPRQLLCSSRRAVELWRDPLVQLRWWRGRNQKRKARLCAYWLLVHHPLQGPLATTGRAEVDVDELAEEVVLMSCQSPAVEQSAIAILESCISSGELVVGLRNSIVIQHCVQVGSLPLTRVLLSAMNADARVEVGSFNDLMDMAVVRGHVEIVELLLEFGLPPSWMALTSAAISAQMRCVRLILAADAADALAEMPVLRWALAYLAERRHSIGIEMVLDCARSLRHNITVEILHHALIIAINAGCGSVIRTLLHYGADTSFQNWEAWYICGSRGVSEVTVAIVEQGNLPSTLWNAAHVPEWVRIMKDLVRAGRDDLLDLCLENLQATTVPLSSASLSDVLVEAARMGNIDCGQLLLGAGALPFATIVAPGMAIFEAAYNGHGEFVQMLVEHHRPSFIDDHGLGPLLADTCIVACERNHFDIVRYLLGIHEGVAQAVMDSLKYVREGTHKDSLRAACMGQLALQDDFSRKVSARLQNDLSWSDLHLDWLLSPAIDSSAS